MPPRRSDVTIIKKYANRRLYHTEISQYITLDDVADMVRKGEDLKVVDARTGADLTRTILTQIIVEQESKGENLLPIKFLRQVIRMYSDKMRPMIPHYLDQTVDTLLNNQEELSKYWTTQMDSVQKNITGIPVQAVQKFSTSVEEIARQNINIFENTMKMFTPFMGNAPGDKNVGDKKQKLDALRQQMKDLQNRIGEIEKS